MTDTSNLSPSANRIRAAVLAAMQDAEELGGVTDAADYLRLMASLSAEIAERVSNAAAHVEGV